MKMNWLFLTGLLTLTGPILAADRAASLQEGIELRRITEYCKEKNYTAVKTQIHTFLTKHPQSPSAESLYAMLGDILFSENSMQEALDAYNLITQEELYTKTEFRRIHCLHQLGKYEEVVAATKNFVEKERATEEQMPLLRLQLANSLFRQALSIEDATQKRELLHLAKEQFNLLPQMQFAEQGLSPLAYIYTFLKDYPQAVKMYTALAEKDPANQEEYLLQIAQLQLKFDKRAAIQTCERIYTLGGRSASQAAYNYINLLFQEKRYRDVILAQDKVLSHLDPEHLPLAHYFIGRSLFQSGDHAQAAIALKKYLASTPTDLAKVKTSQLTIIQCAKSIDNSSLFDETLNDLKKAFPHDEETVKVCLQHAQYYHKKGNLTRAIQDLKELLDQQSNLAQRETILYDYALLLMKEKQWMDGVIAFETFIKDYSGNTQVKSAWRHLINCYVQAVKEASTETAFVKKEGLVTTLTSVLDKKKILSSQERQTIRFLLAKTLCDIEKYDAALGELATFVQDYHAAPQAAEAYLLTALAHQKGTKNYDLFIANAEKTLSLNPQIGEARHLHLTLFNTCLTQAESKQNEEKKLMLLKAADHLYQALDSTIKKDNQLWLANFYFNHYKKATAEQTPFFLDRTVNVLEKLLRFNPQSPELCITDDSLEMEGEAIKLAELYNAQGKNSDQISLLQTLTTVQTQHPEWKWKYQRLALFDLATAYKEGSHAEKALATYSILIDTSTFASSYFATLAELEKALLTFAVLPKEKRKENAPEVQEICDTLKVLEITRKLFSEPCHLEAALSYIDILSELTLPQQRLEKEHKLLQQMKENYSSTKDPLVMEYLASSKEFPEKHLLYQQYMQFVTADTLRAEAQLATDQSQATQLSKQALEMLTPLFAETTHPRLKVRLEKSREALKQLL